MEQRTSYPRAIRPPRVPASKPAPAANVPDAQQGRERFTFFWQGPFSQWYPSRFEVDGVTYSHAEQYMMAEKARLFGDGEVLRMILSAKTPKEQKAMGRKVRGFDESLWNSMAKEIVKRGNIAKFSQNPDLLEKLLSTDGTTLVEASPYDTIWGIGLRADDPLAEDRATWRGSNWLGEILTEVREELRLVCDPFHTLRC